MLFLPERPNFSFGGLSVSWEEASYRVLVVGEERLVRHVLPRFVQALEEYARENGVLLFVPGEEKPFRGNESKLRPLEKLVGGDWGRLKVSDEEELAARRELFGSVALFVGPAAFIQSEAQKVFEIGALWATVTLWRYARVLSFAAFAVLPDSEEFFSAFPELGDALTRARLRFPEAGAEAKGILLPDIAAVCGEG